MQCENCRGRGESTEKKQPNENEEKIFLQVKGK